MLRRKSCDRGAAVEWRSAPCVNAHLFLGSSGTALQQVGSLGGGVWGGAKDGALLQALKKQEKDASVSTA